MAEADIPFALPFIGPEEEAAALRVLRSGWLTTGAEALAFEEEFSDFLQERCAPCSQRAWRAGGAGGLGPPYLKALAVNSATSGLHLALEALGLGPGDAAILPSYTFTATAEVVRYLGAEAVFVDVKPGTFHLDPIAVEAVLDRLERGLPPYPPRPGSASSGFGPPGRPKALIPVHFGGLPCDMDPLLSIAERYGLSMVEDAAHAFPSRLPDGRWTGTIGDLGVFSFYATKTITTGEGGMVAGRNQALMDRIAVMRLHGIDRAAWNRYSDPRASWYYEVIEPGFKYNMPDILAAIGRVQLGRARSLLAEREALARRYDEAFKDEAGLILPPTGPGDARHLYPLRLEAAQGRDAAIRALKEAGIGVSVHFIPLHTMPYYRKRYGLEEDDFPASMDSFRRVISLPLWPGMGEARVERVIKTVKAVIHGR